MAWSHGILSSTKRVFVATAPSGDAVKRRAVPKDRRGRKGDRCGSDNAYLTILTAAPSLSANKTEKINRGHGDLPPKIGYNHSRNRW